MFLCIKEHLKKHVDFSELEFTPMAVVTVPIITKTLLQKTTELVSDIIASTATVTTSATETTTTIQNNVSGVSTLQNIEDILIASFVGIVSSVVIYFVKTRQYNKLKREVRERIALRTYDITAERRLTNPLPQFQGALIDL